MNKVIADAYWRNIKRGLSSIESVREPIKSLVIGLAKNDVLSGNITEDEYAAYVGEEFVSEV